MKKIMACILTLTCLAALGLAPAWADEISNQVERGLKLYKEGKLSEALNELDTATAQIRQKKAEAMVDIFPEAFGGWQADKAESASAGQTMFGGIISASRSYHKGEAQVRVEVLSDSPLIQALAMVLNNPMMMGQGVKLVQVAGNKALLQQQEDNQADLQMLIDNKVLVKVDASQTPGAGQVVQDFAGRVKLDKLRQLSK